MFIVYPPSVINSAMVIISLLLLVGYSLDMGILIGTNCDLFIFS
jgi:hypothetical protein